MKKNALFLACIMIAGLATTCFAPRGGMRGGGGRGRMGGFGGGRGRGGFAIGGGFGRGRGGFGGGWGRGRGRGGFGIGIGFGRGRGWGRPGWRRRHHWGPGWRRRRWWGPAVGVGLGWGYRPYSRPYYGGTRVITTTPREYIDRAGLKFWEIANNTPDPIRVRSGRAGIEIGPGETKELGHPYGFAFTVDTQYGSQTFETQDHNISIEVGSGGQLIAETH